MNPIQAKLDAYYAAVPKDGMMRTQGACWLPQDAKREADLFDYFKRADNGEHDKNSALDAVEIHHPGHSMALPHRFIANWSGNTMWREEGLFMTLCTHGTPTWNTISETTFTDQKTIKRSATEGNDGVRVKTVVVCHGNMSNSFEEEYLIAKK